MKIEKDCGNCNKLDKRRKKTNFSGQITFECIHDKKYHTCNDKACPKHEFPKNGFSRIGFWILTMLKNSSLSQKYITEINKVESLLLLYRTCNNDDRIEAVNNYDDIASKMAVYIESSPKKDEIISNIIINYIIPAASFYDGKDYSYGIFTYFSMLDDIAIILDMDPNVKFVKYNNNIGYSVLYDLCEQLEVKINEDFITLEEYISKSSTELKKVYCYSINTLENFLFNLDYTDKKIVFSKYYNTFIKLAIIDSKKEKCSEEDIINIFKNMIQRINIEMVNYKSYEKSSVRKYKLSTR